MKSAWDQAMPDLDWVFEGTLKSSLFRSLDPWHAQICKYIVDLVQSSGSQQKLTRNEVMA